MGIGEWRVGNGRFWLHRCRFRWRFQAIHFLRLTHDWRRRRRRRLWRWRGKILSLCGRFYSWRRGGGYGRCLGTGGHLRRRFNRARLAVLAHDLIQATGNGVGVCSGGGRRRLWGWRRKILPLCGRVGSVRGGAWLGRGRIRFNRDQGQWRRGGRSGRRRFSLYAGSRLHQWGGIRRGSSPCRRRSGRLGNGGGGLRNGRFHLRRCGCRGRRGRFTCHRSLHLFCCRFQT